MNVVDHQNTKIIATLGPASSSEEKLTELMREGVDIFRLNFSHGDQEGKRAIIERIHMLNEKYNRHTGILADLQGPKIRVGKIENDGVALKAGDQIKFVQDDCLGNKDRVHMQYTDFAKDVTDGEKVLIDDGKLVFKVVSTNKKDEVLLEVLYDCVLHSNKGVNLPDTKVSMPSITEKDRSDLEFVLTQKVHWIALSFVRTSREIKELKSLIAKAGHPAKVIAKIEKPEAVRNLKAIVKESDAIMVARGDLGIEVPMEKIPIIQKRIIKRCIQKARPVIVATQMMDSMINNISPTRAEVTDVANAVLDGADCVMLSGETSVGKYPVETVIAMNKIIAEAEKNYEIQNKRPKPDAKSETFHSDVICFNAAKTAEDIGAKAIISLTKSGYTGYKISSYRPDAKIYIFAPDPDTLSILNLVWGVRCYAYDKFSSTDETIEDVITILKQKKLIKKDDMVINTGSMPMDKRFRTNFLKLTIVE